MENKQGYDPSEFEDDDFSTSQPDAGKSIRGYRIVIIILSVILVAISALYFSIHHQQMLDNELLKADRDSIQNDLGRLMTDYDNLQISNDSISRGLDIERERADSLMTRLKKERSWNLAKIKQYEKEVGTLRSIMKGYVRQIDSLNTLNKQLIKENVGYRKEISSAKLRAEMAEEKAAELDNKVKVGAVLRARDIRLAGLNDRGNPVSRIKNASRLRVDFVLSANDIDILVHGTSFNVRSYADDSEVEVALLDGSIDLRTKNLENNCSVRVMPGELVKLDKRSGQLSTARSS